MKRVSTVVVLTALSVSSCSSIFWVRNVEIPAEKVVRTQEIQIELFDAVGQRCTSSEIDISVANRGESVIISEFTVPKFSSVQRQPSMVNYLWMVDGRDTSVYELVYTKNRKWGLMSTLGAGLVVAAIPVGIIADDFEVGLSTLGIGAVTLVYGGLLIDAPTGIASALLSEIARLDGLQRSWKLKSVRSLPPADYPPALIRGISELGFEIEQSDPSADAILDRVTQP